MVYTAVLQVDGICHSTSLYRPSAPRGPADSPENPFSIREKLKRIQRSKYRSLQAQVFNLWDDYYNQRKNAEQLLRQCAHLNGPKRSS